MNASMVGAVVGTVAPVDFWSPVVVALIPVLVLLLKKCIPADFRNELKVVYPVAAVMLGPLLDYGLTFVTSHQAGPHSVLFGLVAIGMREFFDQVKKVGAPSAKMMIACAIVGVACAGCGTSGLVGGNSSVGDPLGALAKFTQDDLTAALKDSLEKQDRTAADCWSTLLGLLQEGIGGPPLKIIGLATGIQAKRDLMGQGGTNRLGDLKKEINRGCAALFVDEAYALEKLGLLGFTGGLSLGF